jgi:hypothetical protein
VTTHLHLENSDPTAKTNATDLDLRYQAGEVEANLRAVFGFSSPVVARASLPLLLEKKRLRDDSFLDRSRPFSVNLNFPALFLATLPEKLRPVGVKGGVASGEIAYSGTLRDPKIVGAAQLLDLKITPPAPWPSLTNLNAEINFESHVAEIPSLRFDLNSETLRWNGRFAMRPPAFSLALTPLDDLLVVEAPPRAELNAQATLQKVTVKGEIDSPRFSLMIQKDVGPATFFFDPSSKRAVAPFHLHIVPAEPTLELRVSDTQSQWP